MVRSGDSLMMDWHWKTIAIQFWILFVFIDWPIKDFGDNRLSHNRLLAGRGERGVRQEVGDAKKWDNARWKATRSRHSLSWSLTDDERIPFAELAQRDHSLLKCVSLQVERSMWLWCECGFLLKQQHQENQQHRDWTVRWTLTYLVHTTNKLIRIGTRKDTEEIRCGDKLKFG